MAVENKYVNSNVAAGKKVNSAFNEGQHPLVMVCTFEIAAANDDGSIFRLFKNVNPDLIPVRITLFNDAITGCTSVDLGLYEPLEMGGAVIDKALLLAAEDIHAGNTRASAVDGLSAVAIENVQKSLMELAGHTLTTRKRGYDIALTANTIGSAAGTVSVIAEFIQG